MSQEPRIVSCSPQTYMGLRANFIGAASPRANNLKVIPNLWESFFRRIQEIPTIQPGVCYGLSDTLSALKEGPSQPDELAYLAALQVAESAVALPGMAVWTTRGGEYACFVHRGAIKNVGATMGYIYGEWFPKGAYEREDGPEFECYDERFEPASKDSVFEIFIPVRKKKPRAAGYY